MALPEKAGHLNYLSSLLSVYTYTRSVMQNYFQDLKRKASNKTKMLDQFLYFFKYKKVFTMHHTKMYAIDTLSIPGYL